MNFISLIIVTLGREVEIDFLLKSLTDQLLDKSFFEVIIVDQNTQIDLIPIIEKYKSFLEIIYIKSKVVGQSKNRNIGLMESKGEIVCFPDDDCKYYPDTLSSVKKAFDDFSLVQTVMGQIVDINTNKKIIRQWGDNDKVINKNNFFYNYSMITIFTKNKIVTFDEMFGVGKRFGAYEDADYVLGLLEQGVVMYTPKIRLWHPELNVQTMSLEKVKNYSMGFGGLCRKHLSFSITFLFINVISFHFFKLMMAFVKLNFQECLKRYFSIFYRIKGFVTFERDHQ